jgi:hypothetical protein
MASETSRCARLRGAPLSDLSPRALPFALSSGHAQAPAVSITLSATAICADTPLVLAWSGSLPMKPAQHPATLFYELLFALLRCDIKDIVSASFCAVSPFRLVIPYPCSFAVPSLLFGFRASFASPASI